MSEKRCEWCGTLSPADAEKCTLCRIAFGVPVPPPRDWSELTGNIPVITAPLLEEPIRAAAGAPASPSASSAQSPASPPPAPPPSSPVAPAAYRVPAQAHPVAAEAMPASPAPTLVPPLSVAAVAAPLAEPSDAGGEGGMPGWRAPDDPTLRVFADRLEERDRRRSAPSSPSRRRRRRLLRLLVWLVAIGLIAAALVLAQARLPLGS